MRNLLLVLLAIYPLGALSAPFVHSPSSALTIGPSALPYSLQSVAHNPAAGSLVVNSSEKLRFGYLSTVGGSFEYGEVANFEDDLDELIDILDDGISDDDSVDEVLDRFNGVLEEIANDGYFKLEGSGSLPIFPLVFNSDMLGGTVSINLAHDIQARGSILYDELRFRDEIDTSAALYLKGAVLNRFGVGYSRPVYTRGVGMWKGTLIAGARLNVLSASLSKQVFGLTNLDGESVTDVIQDEFTENQEDTTEIGLDVGFIWRADKYQVGLTITNLNQPEFDYGPIADDCESISNPVQQSNCFIARTHVEEIGAIDAAETHEMNALTTVDASFMLTPRLILSGSAELGDYNDLVGDENQWVTLSATHFPRSSWLPAWRIGYRSNLVGSELSSLALGVTLFKVFNFDLDYGLDTVTIDGSSAPRSIGINFGFEESF